MDQQNWIEGPEINPHSHGQLICDIGGENIQWRKGSLFNKWCWENWTAKCKRVKLEHSPTSYSKIKCILLFYLNVRPYIMKLLEENIGKAFFDINCSTVFFFFFFGSISSYLIYKGFHDTLNPLFSRYVLRPCCVHRKSDNKFCALSLRICVHINFPFSHHRITIKYMVVWH